MRRTLTVTIQPFADPSKQNRDVGKSFLLTEKDAIIAEEWGLRAMLALGNSGIAVPQEMADAGLIGVALIGYQAFMGSKFEEIAPLWREMLTCIEYLPSEGIKMPFHSTLVEEVSTLLLLREKILELHTGFTLAELAQKLRQATLARQNLQNTSTSPKSLEPLSA